MQGAKNRPFFERYMVLYTRKSKGPDIANTPYDVQESEKYGFGKITILYLICIVKYDMLAIRNDHVRNNRVDVCCWLRGRQPL